MAGCSEMEFCTKTITLTQQLLNVFADITCSELKPDINDDAIEELPAEYFKRIAYALKNNRYSEWEKEFRVQEYKAYSNNEEWATKLKIKKYTDLDNPPSRIIIPVTIIKINNLFFIINPPLCYW